MRIYALIPAAGNGVRCGGDAPKQYGPLRGKPLLMHSIERLVAALPLHHTYVAIAPGDLWCEAAVGTHANTTLLRCGGATRAETVRNALALLTDAADDDWVLVHDAVRPCVEAVALRRLQQAVADDAVGGLLALPVVGTLKRAGAQGRSEGTAQRDGLWQAQTPQMFRYRVLRDAHADADAAHFTDEAQAVEKLGLSPLLVAGDPTNIKITYAEDLKLAAAIMSAQQVC
ncbi:MAG TPA: 2-C-methyl-D-erythritol 4-phosphate cytidylyltransferase [Casimicrobiaceae bacterium]